MTLVRLRPATEAQVQASIKRLLRQLGFYWIDTSQPFRAAITPGLADLIVMGRGVIAFVECRSERGRLTSAQKQFRSHVETNGGTYLVARSAKDVAEWVDGLPKRSSLKGENG